MILRRIFLLWLVALAACSLTPYQRFADYAEVARADLHSPAMNKAICDVGAMTKECGWTGR